MSATQPVPLPEDVKQQIEAVRAADPETARQLETIHAPARPLAVADHEQLKKDMGFDEVKTMPLALAVKPEVLALAVPHADRIIAAASGSDVNLREEMKQAVENLGLRTQREAATASKMLKEPVRALMAAGDDGGQVANDLVSLKFQVEGLDPAKFDLAPGWGTRMIGMFFPDKLANPLRRYFVRYESADAVITSIIMSLGKGREQLERDNDTLAEDQKQMRALTKRLEQVVAVGKAIESKIVTYLSGLDPQSEERAYLEEEVLFTLRQRLIDLEQQLTVNLQGILAIEVIRRNNVELIRGVNRAENITVSALRVAVTVALGLAHQEIVLKKLDAVSAVTDAMIYGTAVRLRQQGVAIHKRAAGAMLSMETLKKAFVEINGAMEDIASFRREALPQMETVIGELDVLSGDAEKNVLKMERGNRAKVEIDLPIDAVAA